MTEFEVKDLILDRMANLIPNSTNLDLSYMAGTLKTLETIGKPDPSENYFNSVLESLKEMNKKRFEDIETLIDDKESKQ